MMEYLMTNTNFLPVDINQVAESIQDVVSGHKTLAQLNGVKQSELEQAYQSALERYQEQDMSGALTHFTYLVMNNPWRREYMFGMASTLHALDQFEHALTFYGYATLMNACDAGVTFRIGQCYLSLKKQLEAIDALQTSIEQSYIPPEQPEIRSIAQSLLDDITD